jgi:hypothetical protein
MFSGVYKVYRNGELIAEQSNSITKAGKAIILKSIMGVIPTIGGSIQAGISNVANQTAVSGLIPDTNLGFSICSSPVFISYLDNSGAFDALVFKTTIPGGANSGNRFKIYELGLYPLSPSSNQQFYDTTLFSGYLGDNWTLKSSGVPITNQLNKNDISKTAYIDGISIDTTGSYVSSTTFSVASTTGVAIGQKVTASFLKPETTNFYVTNISGSTITVNTPTTETTGSGVGVNFSAYDFRVGDTILFLKGDAVTPANSTILMSDAQKVSNLGMYSSEDQLCLAYSKLHTTNATIKIRFFTDASSYYEYTFNPNNTTITDSLSRYGILTQLLGAATITGSPSWSTIKYVEMQSNADILIDAIRINNNDNIDTVTGLVSRTVLNSPIEKVATDSIDIEYYLSMSFNKTVV